MSEIITHENIPRGYLKPGEIDKYVNRILCAAELGDAAPSGRAMRFVGKEGMSDQRKAEVTNEVDKICAEWRERVYVDCSYRRLGEEYWKENVKKKIEENVHEIIERITEKGLDSGLKLICVTWLRDFCTGLEYCPNKVFIEPKDIYDSLWKCRDFELNHLWQRSVFLTTFLVMCFTGYGTVFLKLVHYIDKITVTRIETLVMLNSAEVMIALVSILLSVMWIMMGKGSKAWYEQYENSITAIETNPKYSGVIPDMEKDRVMHGSLQDPSKVNDCLFNPRAGRYSVSRINICIGQVSLGIWILLFLMHIGLFFCETHRSNNVVDLICFPCILKVWWKLLLVYIIPVAVIVYMIFRGIPTLGSSFIKANDTRDRKISLRKERRDIRKEKRHPRTLIVVGYDSSTETEAKAGSDNDGNNTQDASPEGSAPGPDADKDPDKPDNKIRRIQMRIDSEVSFDCKTISWIKFRQKSRVLDVDIIENGNTEDFIIRNRRFFNKLIWVNMVVAYGLSFSKEQRSYLKGIPRITGKDTFWIIVLPDDKVKDEQLNKDIQMFMNATGLTRVDIVSQTEFSC